MLKKLKDYFRRLKIAEEKIKMQEARIVALEQFVQTARDIQERKNLGVDAKKKWLNSYPDETISTNKKGA